jgi:hypothetical protein
VSDGIVSWGMDRIESSSTGIVILIYCRTGRFHNRLGGFGGSLRSMSYSPLVLRRWFLIDIRVETTNAGFSSSPSIAHIVEIGKTDSVGIGHKSDLQVFPDLCSSCDMYDTLSAIMQQPVRVDRPATSASPVSKVRVRAGYSSELIPLFVYR